MSDLLNVENIIGGVVRRLSGRTRHRRQKSNVPLVIATIGYGAGAVGGTNNTTTSVVNRDVIASGMKRLFAQEEAFSRPDQTIRSITTEVVEPPTPIVRVPTRSSLVSYATSVVHFLARTSFPFALNPRSSYCPRLGYRR
jgi:hypothetical protein